MPAALMGRVARRGNATLPLISRTAALAGGAGAVPAAWAKFAIGGSACSARAEGLGARPSLLHLHLRQLRFDGGCACARVLVALARGHEEPEQRLRWRSVHAAPLLVEDAKIVLAIRDAELGRLSEPAERGRFVERRAFATREIDAEIVHGAAIARRRCAFGPLPGDCKVCRHAFTALIELGQAVLRHREAAIGGAAQHGDALIGTASADALERQLVLRCEIARLRKIGRASCRERGKMHVVAV